MRLKLPLNNGWKSLPRPPADFTATSFDDSAWSDVRIPHTNLEQPLDNLDPASFRFTTGYRQRLTFPPAWSGQRVFVVFEGVMARAEVWFDGKKVAEHRGGYTPFEAEVPLEVVASGSTLLAVVADAEEDPGIPPFGNQIDYLTFGGIYREVHLEVRPHLYLETLTLETPAPGLGHLRVKGSLCLDRPWNDPIPLIGTVRVFDRTSDEEKASGAVGWAPGSIDAPYDLEVPTAVAWDLENPALYELRVETNDDFLVRHFGFRRAEFRPEGFFLNGKHVKLRGLNRHQSWPVVGYAMPRRAQAADADMLKTKLGCNIVRSSHYPASRHFLDRCDEIGLLVFEEIPGWQHIGGPEWKNVAITNVEEMILRDRHRPSVILWGVRINESPDDDDFYRTTNAAARRLDTTRPTGGVRNFGGSALFEDVYTYNDFVHSGGAQALDTRRKIARKKVPYLVTEHNGHMFPTKKGDPEARRVEHALRHARVQNAAAASADIAGALGWCFADYATHGDFGSGDQICHHGVVDQFRCFKPAAAFYASQGATPYGQVASRLAKGDHDGSFLKQIWVFTNSPVVKVFQQERLIGSFGPRKALFPALPHPPVLVDDLIGDALESEPGLSKSDARRVKKFLLAYQKKGGMPSLNLALPLFWVMFKKKWTTGHVQSLYFRHVGGWGAGGQQLRFEGWSDKKDWEQTLGPAHAVRLELSLDTQTLVEGDTYDVVRAEMRLIDSNGNEVWYGAAPVALEVEGPLAVIGPATRPLTGGSTAFWLKTTGLTGSAILTARSGPFSAQARLEI